MRRAIDLLRNEPVARWFFAAHAQSSLGTGAAYVTLVVVAYDRFRSPWAITLILLAEFLPGMALGPLLGAAADRWSRRWCAVIADAVRALAFVSLWFVGSFEATVVLATLAGAANGLYRPAVLAALPGLVSRERAPAGTALYGALTDAGYTLGPAIAAAGMLAFQAEDVLLVNGLTFGVSAWVLFRLDFGAAPETEPGVRRMSLLKSAIDGMRAAAVQSGVRTLILASSAVVLFAGLFNVGELLLAENELGAGGSGYSLLVTVYGAAVAVGSLAGARGGAMPSLARNYAVGVFIVGIGMLASAFAPALGVALATFAVAGFGNGLVVVYERLLLQGMVPDRLMGRVFGVSETFSAWGFGIAFLLGGAVATLFGTRELLAVAGGGVLLVWLVVVLTIRHWVEAEPVDQAAVDGQGAVPKGSSPKAKVARIESAGVGRKD